VTQGATPGYLHSSRGSPSTHHWYQIILLFCLLRV